MASELRLNVLVFLTLRHQVVVAGKLGPLHSHSCSVEVEVSPAEGGTIPFAELEAATRAEIMPFDGKVLNDLREFQDVNPTIENFAAYLYKRLSEVCSRYRAVVHSVTVRESPTRGVKYLRREAQVSCSTPGVGVASGEGQSRDRGVGQGGKLPVAGSLSESPNQRPAGDFELSMSGMGSAEQSAQPTGRHIAPSHASGVRASAVHEHKGPVASFESTHVFSTVEVASSRAESKSKLPTRKDRKRSRRREISGTWKFASVLITIILYVLTAALFYRSILWPTPGNEYPWGSDTWGHIQKAEFMLEEIRNKNYFPCFSPMWYNGFEPFRYWAPLPYYLLALLIDIIGNPFIAAGWYVVLCAILGAVGWLLMSRRLGFYESAAAGLVWLIWHDNVRVAMSEGNLPRVLAAALYPYLLSAFAAVLDSRSERGIGNFIALSLLSGVVIVAHAMIAATFFIALGLVAVAYGLSERTGFKNFLKPIFAILMGIGLSCWWLVPSLQGGVLAADREAVTWAMQYFPLTISMNPVLRISQPETFYWGISLAVAGVLVLATRGHRPPLSRVGIAASTVFVAVSTPAMKPVYSSLPMSHLIFPLYMSTAATGMALMSAFSWDGLSEKTVLARSVRNCLTFLTAVLFLVDCYPSRRLVATRTEPAFLTEAAAHLSVEGWREATLDVSRFGSAGTYILGLGGRREQVFGWAWQGATTASNIVDINVALRSGFYPYVLDRLVELGATDIVLRRGEVDEEAFISCAEKLGFAETWRSDETIVLSTTGGPYALSTSYGGIVIGKFAPNWTMMFPALAEGGSLKLDDYSCESLSQYGLIIVSGAYWEDRTHAEELLSCLAASGKTVLVDTEGLPREVLSNRPQLFGVVGEPLVLYDPLEIIECRSGKPAGTLVPFDRDNYPWKAMIPQGLDEVEYKFEYAGQEAAVLGSKSVRGGKVWFMGANLLYHAYLTRDRLAIGIVSRVLGLDPNQLPVRHKVWLRGYEASSKGYSFTVDVTNSVTLDLVIPIANRENLLVCIDGADVKARSLHNLLSISVPPGLHSVEVIPRLPSSMRLGAWISAASLALLALLSAVGRAPRTRLESRASTRRRLAQDGGVSLG